MKKILIFVVIVAIIAGLYQQVNIEIHLYIKVFAFILFMIGMMQLSAKTPSKNQNKDDENV
ncbi:L-asparagine transporter-like permease [Flavobacterium sp. PL11]|jgi:L-asparagine transporter-like permease|uniref:hypothetical protein n=1 Tax=Flavobacterium sp. PL11 TaxID=3071717 RepID=UPI002E04A859|nr:L-asparagine transporter-like permease [Flavobacterium sp. PL11]